MNKDRIISIFSNLGFKVVKDDVLGDLIEMDAKSAFVFSSIVGSSYLIFPTGVTMKGRCEVFIHRSIFSNGYYIYSPGLFSRNQDGKLVEGDSANRLFEKYPSVFEGKKYIYIYDIEISSLSNIEGYIFDDLKSKNKKPDNYILYKNFISGASTEPLFEYFASIIFNNKGYLTENQVPWFQQNLKHGGNILQGGIPDFSAFHCNMSSYLQSLGIINQDCGVPVNLLPVIKNFQKIEPYKEGADLKSDYELIIGEAKTSKSSLGPALNQLKKYNDVQLASELYTIIPDVSNNSNDLIGEIYLDGTDIKINKSNLKIETDIVRQDIDNKWLSTYIKVLLLGNLPFIKIIELITDYRANSGLEVLDQYEAVHLLDAIQNYDDKLYFEYLTKNISYGLHK